MFNVVIIEDEKPGIEKLKTILTELMPDINIAAIISSVKEGITYFSIMPAHDMIFCDIHLTDGLSFEIFNNFKVDSPIIFTTAYNEFLMKAFDYNSIDYLLKPLHSAEVSKAIQKYKMLQQHFSQHAQRLNNLMEYLGAPKKTRLVVKKGLEHIAIRMDDVVLFYTENKVVYLLDKNRGKYIYDKNLSISEAELDPNIFFRANRKFIVNINYIKSYRPFEKVKLQVDFTIPDINQQVIISQETAPEFKKWLSGDRV